MDVKKVKDPAHIVAAIEEVISFGELGHDLKTGSATAQTLRALTSDIEAVANVRAAQIDVRPLQRCLAYVALSSYAKDYRYSRGTDEFEALVAFQGAILTGLMGVTSD